MHCKTYAILLTKQQRQGCPMRVSSEGGAGMVEALHRAVPPPPGTDIENQTHPAFLANSEAGLGGTEAIAYQTIPLTFATPGPEHGHVWYSSKHEKSTMEAPRHCEHIAGGRFCLKRKRRSDPNGGMPATKAAGRSPAPGGHVAPTHIYGWGTATGWRGVTATGGL